MAVTWTAPDGTPIYLTTSGGTLTFSLGGKANYSFDGAGRLLGAWHDGITFRRALDNRVLAKWPDPVPPQRRMRRILPPDEAETAVARAYAAASDLQTWLAQGTLQLDADSTPTLRDEVCAWLATVTQWDWAQLQADAAQFHRVYKPVSILPPDQYLALVLQATEGCSYNECTFCTFYRDRPFRIKSPTEFGEHCREVAAFMGAGIGVRRSIFLADANAVIIAQSRLLPLLDEVHRHFHVEAAGTDNGSEQLGDFDGIYAFISAPDALHKSADDFAAMRARGVRRLYVGVETGYDPLRQFLAKPGLAADVQAAIRTIKAGGVSVGIILMVGVGGKPFCEEHFAASTALVQSLPLDGDDLIYLSPFVGEGATPYQAAMHAAGYAELDEAAIEAEMARFKAALSLWATARRLRLSRYDVREFIY